MSITPIGGWDGKGPIDAIMIRRFPRTSSKTVVFLISLVTCGLLFGGAYIFNMTGVIDASPTVAKRISNSAQHLSTSERVYSVSKVDARKNEIATGTELYVKGTLYSEVWTQRDECTWLLAGRPLKVQHGEIDPKEYCRFSILLSATGENGESKWPGVSLVCDTTPKEMHRIAREFSYGESVQVHGMYADPLDFGVVPSPGQLAVVCLSCVHAQ